ncbi:hypothetical protein TCELL_1381 [Thermogladius calderae 1633]|uniref:Uncharacterized protein n=1 Tax=Thermogladius calderae (strain DSM 22663 / VKM B-2946 / 1633) TaxID=1184251 RepID=I3TGB5_THEC1|nr:hypothetical protein TCELL_1381 [Thermogladius calderae 1633]
MDTLSGFITALIVSALFLLAGYIAELAVKKASSRRNVV